MIVSKPLKVKVEIEDLTTGCSYLYSGESVEDCKKYFLSMFFGIRPYKVIYIENIA